jgi:F0F1-type ATP synthase delta subunit
MNNNLNLVYASVLFDIARKENKIPLFLEYAQKILYVINRQPKFTRLLNDLNISKEERKNIVQNLLSDQTDISFVHFI